MHCLIKHRLAITYDIRNVVENANVLCATIIQLFLQNIYNLDL